MHKLKIYPNPSQEILFLTKVAAKQISIINTNGLLIYEQKNSSNQIRIKELTAGTYFLKIVLKNNTIITKKFIKN